MADAKKVNVKLAARCIVHGQEREAGEIVELPEKADDGGDLAAVFGEIVKAPAAAVSTPAKPDDGK
jgi:hypothetical protein